MTRDGQGFCVGFDGGSMVEPVLSQDPFGPARRHVKSGEFRQALDELDAMAESQRESPEWQLLTAMASWRLGRFAQSHECAQKALEGYRTVGDSDGEMRAQNVAAAGSFAMGRLDDARVGFERALMLAGQRNDHLMKARCANNLGNTAFYAGQNERALALYNQAVNLFRQIDSLRGMAEAWHNIGEVLRTENDLDGAREATDRALDAAERVGDGRMLGWTLGARGETDALLGDLPLAEAETSRALKLSRAHDDRLTEIENVRSLGVIARARNDLLRALSLVEEAVSLAQAIDNPWHIAMTHRELGNTLLRTNRREEARRALEVARDAFRRIGAETRAGTVQADIDRL